VLVISLTVIIGIFRLVTSAIQISDVTDALLLINIFAILPFIIAVFIYSKVSKTHYRLQKELDERRNMQIYLQELEQQYTSIRKFKHDYQNILTSMDNFFMENNWEALKTYYFNKVKPASEIINQDNPAFGALEKIKIPEIKSLIFAKVFFAKNMSEEIEVSLEATDDIENINMDSIKLVRMLGIILDNAIEELGMLTKGKLAIACFKTTESVTFVVENTCRHDVQNIQLLKQGGFSTKSNHEGLGLHILNELQASDPNVTLSTIIGEVTFTQKLTISEGRFYD
jgi:two-component system sensor histidine kinase AgrC